MKQVFPRFRLIRYAYESLRCLYVEIWRFWWGWQTTDKPIASPLLRMRTRGVIRMLSYDVHSNFVRSTEIQWYIYKIASTYPSIADTIVSTPSNTPLWSIMIYHGGHHSRLRFIVAGASTRGLAKLTTRVQNWLCLQGQGAPKNERHLYAAWTACQPPSTAISYTWTHTTLSASIILSADVQLQCSIDWVQFQCTCI